MLLVFKEMESWIIYDFFIYIPIPLNRNDLSQINIYYVNFDKPIIISTFVAINLKEHTLDCESLSPQRFSIGLQK